MEIKGSKSPKLDAAVARARGQEMVKADDAGPVDVQALQGGELSAFMGHVSTDDIAKRLAAGAKAPVQIYEIPEGAAVCVIVDKTETIQLLSKDQRRAAAGEMDDVQTWSLTLLGPTEPVSEGGATFKRWVRGPRVSVIGGAQMDRQLPELLGRVAICARGGQIKTKAGLPLNEWFCIGVDVRDVSASMLVESVSEEAKAQAYSR